MARRRVVVMDQSGGCELERLGFTVVKVGHLATCLEPFTTLLTALDFALVKVGQKQR